MISIRENKIELYERKNFSTTLLDFSQNLSLIQGESFYISMQIS